MPYEPTIEEARHVQDHFGYEEFHVAYIVPDESFVLAHTDAEREQERLQGHSLYDCPVHAWLSNEVFITSEAHFTHSGWYLITDVGDAVGLAF